MPIWLDTYFFSFPIFLYSAHRRIVETAAVSRNILGRHTVSKWEDIWSSSRSSVCGGGCSLLKCYSWCPHHTCGNLLWSHHWRSLQQWTAGKSNQTIFFCLGEFLLMCRKMCYTVKACAGTLFHGPRVCVELWITEWGVLRCWWHTSKCKFMTWEIIRSREYLQRKIVL